jgi:hypothetical protein
VEIVNHEGKRQMVAGGRAGANMHVDATYYNRTCGQCGAWAILLDRFAADSTLHIWFACTTDGCTGQWLAKRSLPDRIFV